MTSLRSLPALVRAAAAWLTLTIALCSAAPVRAAETRASEPDDDRFSLRARSVTYLRLFQRSLLPGPGGALVSTDTLAPTTEYLSLSAEDLDAAWSRDSLDVELSAWGSGLLYVDRGSADHERLWDGDVTVANLRHRIGPAYLRAGRQVVTAGVSRLARIDGIAAGARAPFGLALDAFAGLTVLPRWAERPGYHHLGSAADSLLRDPEALPEPHRADHWVIGSRLSWIHATRGGLGLSLFEQAEGGEIARRDLGLDLLFLPLPELELLGDATVDADSGGIVEARARADGAVTREIELAVEYRRAEPALLLSRQSVLSVFASDELDEVGSEVGYRPTSRLQFVGAQYLEVFGGDRLGARSQLRTRVVPDASRRVTVQLVLARVTETQNGYFSSRASLGYRVLEPARITLEHTTYLYDQPIRGISASSVEAASGEWTLSRELSVLLGSSVARSPYAALDAQALLRVSYGLDAGGAR